VPIRRPEPPLTPSLLLALLLTGGLLGLAAIVEERRRRAPALPPPAPSSSPAAGEPVTVLLPVRDEEANVLPCLDGLLAQTVRPAVRVIDDGSTDATASLAAGRAAAEPRLALLQAGPLPAGWRGKLHALAMGARGVETPWLLSTDADTRHHPELLARALAAARERRLDAVSLAGSQQIEGPGENLLVPTVFALLDTLRGDWEAAADSTGAPVANGQFLLLRREALERCGGFEAVRGAAIDDVALAGCLRAAGYRTGFLRAPGLLTVRMYRGLGEAARGWRRNLGGLFGARPATATAVLAVLLGPPAALLGFLLAGQTAPALLLWVAGAAASITLRAGSGHRRTWGLLYPADALLLAWVLARGVLDHRRGRLASWKGREMRV
jgi:cellulose synthase/poly-beta-1,6-N-acetylglucosamine synthase-like glycosyltransferase